MRWRIAGFLLLLPILAVAAGSLWLRSSLPPLARHRVVAGLTAEVRIARDASGVPTITAGNDADSAFALGYVHAEDRLFQMDLQRRYGAGRLAEWFGAGAIESDRVMRTLGLARAAERQLALLPRAVQAALNAYAAGVNAYLGDRREALPLEYYLLRAEPQPWRPVDSLIWGKLMAWRLAGNYRNELVRARIAEHASAEEMRVLYPAYPEDGPVVLGALSKLYRDLPFDPLIALMQAPEDPVRASNNWVVSGARTASGKPILANDPHLGLEAPGVWYLARIVTPQHRMVGGTAAGAPFVIIGHNERIAWGFTNTESDVSDLFIEKIDPDDSSKYLAPDGALPFKTRMEEIHVRGGAPVALAVRETRHGPVISDLGFAAGIAHSGYALALEATYLLDSDRTPEALWQMDHATNWEEFHTALADFSVPEQNIVYADVDGHIAFAAPGRVPIRAKGDGWLPMPGWTGEYDWTGFIPFGDLPLSLDPPVGRIVTANNKVVPDNYPFFISRDWDLPNRAARITMLLDQGTQTVDSSMAIQRDIFSPMADKLLPMMLEVQPSSPRARAAIDRLEAWDRRMDRNAVAPLIFVAWLREFNRAVLADKLGAAFDDYWDLHPAVISSILTDHINWCDDRTTPVTEVCGEQLAAALDRALDQLTRSYGDTMDDWRWGRAHAAKFRNPFLSRLPVIDRLVATSIPADGGADTINRGGSVIRDPTAPYEDVHGPELRMVVDLADPADARFMIAPGQSGNPLSPHYGDLIRPWRDGAMMTVEGEPSVATEILSPP